MNILVKRIYTNDTYTISHIYADGSYVCDGLEDADRGLDQSMTEAELMKMKVKSRTAIPTGKYKVTLDVISPKMSKKKYYMDICGGRVPRVLDVKAYSGILIHVGNTHTDTAGCLLVGYNKIKGKVINSKEAFEKLYHMMKIAKSIGEQIWIEYVRTYQK